VTINSIKFENFRSFVDGVDVQLRPLTLLFGYNSAGKSALLRGLPLIAASLRTQERAPIALVCPAARQASFSDLLPHPALSASRRLGISLSLRLRSTGAIEEGRITWRITDLPDLKQQVVEDFECAINGGLHLKAQWHPAASNSARPANQYTIHLTHDPDVEAAISFQGLVPEFPESPESWQKPLKRLKELFKELRTERNNVQWLSSVRRTPDRHIRWRSTAPSMLEPDGSGAADILAYDDLAKGPLLGEVSAWYEKHLGWRLKVSQLADQYRLMMEPAQNSPVEVYFSDVGEGLVQVLPVLVAAARLRDSSGASPRILAVEEPESHLHPRLHAALTEKFCELAALPDPPQIVVETHSENVLLRVQLAVASGQLPPENVIVYWVRQSSDGRSRIDPVEFDPLGQPKGNWPPGVFAEDLEQARRLLELQRRSSS
jgi:predicted ATPase